MRRAPARRKRPARRVEPAAGRSIAHVPALDGMRGVAVLGVLAFHAGALRGGYLGVDLFFVLSGYLITSLLLAEHAATGTIDLRAFWLRRARRLFPALLALVPFVAAYAWLLAKPRELPAIRRDALATLAYVSNWAAIAAGRSYWSLFTAPSPLEHTWSLAIEEQFYLVWPLAFVWFARRFGVGARRAGVAVAVLAAASMAAMAWRFDPNDTSRAYLGTDTRGAAILLGCLLAIAMRDRVAGPAIERAAKRHGAVLSGVAVAVLALAWTFLDGESAWLYRGGFWACEAAVAVLLGCARFAPDGLVSKAFSYAPLRLAGTISYGVYLWHWPLFVVLTTARTRLDGAALAALRIVATFVAAGLSYVALERPIRTRGLPGAHPFALAAACFAGVAALAVASTRVAPAVAVHRNATGAIRVLVVGDSVAASLGASMQHVEAEARAAVDVRGVEDCSILDARYPTRSLTRRPHAGGACDRRWSEEVAALRPDATVVLLGGGFYAPAQIAGAWRQACDPAWNQAYFDRLVEDLRTLDAHSTRVFVATAPYPTGSWGAPVWNARVDCFNDVVRRAAERVEGVRVLDLPSLVCPRPGCDGDAQFAGLREDGLHYGGDGGDRVARWVLGRVR